jgi:hypothetical protein
MQMDFMPIIRIKLFGFNFVYIIELFYLILDINAARPFENIVNDVFKFASRAHFERREVVNIEH